MSCLQCNHVTELSPRIKRIHGIANYKPIARRQGYRGNHRKLFNDPFCRTTTRRQSPVSRQQNDKNITQTTMDPRREKASANLINSIQIPDCGRLDTTHWQQLWILLISPDWNRNRIGTRRGSGTRTGTRIRTKEIKRKRKKGIRQR